MAVVTISLSDASVKLLSADFSLGQVFTLRSTACLIGLWVMTRAHHFQSLWRTKRLYWVLLRNTLMVFQIALFYAALPNVPLSVAAASIYTMPLFASILAFLFLTEKGGPRVWLGILLGYGGVILILQPQGGDFNYYVLLPLGAALLAALCNLVTKSKCSDEHPLAISFNLNFLLLIVGVVGSAVGLIWNPPESQSLTLDFLLRDWTVMGSQEWLAISSMAFAFAIGSIAAAFAYQIGPISRVATLDFTYIVFAAIWGVLFFAEIPTLPIVLGIALIIFAGLQVTRSN